MINMFLKKVQININEYTTIMIYEVCFKKFEIKIIFIIERVFVLSLEKLF